MLHTCILLLSSRSYSDVSICDCFQAGAEEMEGFTKEVLMMWKVLVVEGGRCIVPRAGKKGIKQPCVVPSL